MQPRLIWTIFRKDVVDAIRDGRVLVALLVPLGLGVFYNAVFDDDIARPSASAAFSSQEATRLPDLLREIAGDRVKLDLRQVEDEAAVRALVADEEVDLGVIVPAGFDRTVIAGETPTLPVLLPDSTSFGTTYLQAVLVDAVRRLAGFEEPARFETIQVAPLDDDQLVFDEIGTGPYFVVTSTIFLVVMIAMFVVPIILTEEVERKTLDALVMIASYADVIVAKALVGLVYTVVAVVLMIVVTRLDLAEPVAFAGAVVLLSLALTGFGLLLGGLFRSANQLNTWGSVILLPVAAPAFAVGLPVPDGFQSLLDALPTGQATKLALNAHAGRSVFDTGWLAYAVLLAWALAAYLLLLWRLSRREG